MPDVHSFLLFLAAGLALNFTPGPDMLYVAARGASEGRPAGVASAYLGVAVGASRAASRLRGASRARDILQKITGALFIGLGLRLAFGSRS